ncbi:MAG: hypothetical protein AVDCRST_MAG77-1215, partial [uncultured Chloroflexi bacterium]
EAEGAGQGLPSAGGGPGAPDAARGGSGAPRSVARGGSDQYAAESPVHPARDQPL